MIKYLQELRIYEGIVFTLIFTLLFIVMNLVMIDYRGLQDIVTGQDLFLILSAILAWLFRNSYVSLTKTRGLFLTVWMNGSSSN